MANPLESLKAALADRYTIEKEIGSGGMAIVYLAQDLKHRRKVAIKVLKPELTATIGPGRFVREIEVAAGLQHPHILTLIDSGEADGLLYYVMPYVEGESLRDKLTREGELPIVESALILREIADALAYAHARGIVHRDIKPDNVLLTGQHAVITDFGVAKAVSEATGGHTLTTAGVALGTPAYMAPEQAAADPHTDHRADIYAFGVTAYEMLTGQPPFTGRSPQAILSAHVTEAPDPVTRHRGSVPPALAALIMRCLAKKPADRWQSAREIAQQLESFSTPASGMMPIGAGGPLRMPSKSRLVAGSAGLILVIALSYGAWSGWFGDERIPTIAVLPFENLGAAEDQYFVDGMALELNTRLQGLSGLTVIARTSTTRYKSPRSQSVQEIGQALGADYLVDGTVLWEKGPAGSRVRISPQLVRVRGGTQVWAERYDEAYGVAIFSIQTRIAERVADALSVALVPSERLTVAAVPTQNTKAHDYFLRGQEHTALGGGQRWEAQRVALEMYQAAVRLDPGFGLAHAWVARAQQLLAASGYDTSLPTRVTRAERIEMIREAADRALSIDSGLADAQVALAGYYALRGDTLRQRESLDRVLRAQPSNSQAHLDQGSILLQRGDLDAAIKSFTKAVSLDPMSAGVLRSVASRLATRGKFAAAEPYAIRAIELAPNDPAAYIQMTWMRLGSGRLDEARQFMRDGMREAGAANLLFAVAQNGVYIRMLRILREDFERSTQQLSSDVFGSDSVDFYKMKAMAFHSDPVRARHYYDSLRIWALPRIDHETPPRHGVSNHIVLVEGLAGSGHIDAARKELALLRAEPVSPTHPWRPSYYEFVAEVCVLMADYDCAFELLNIAMEDPYIMTPSLLRLDPIWDPIRNDPRYHMLLKSRQ